MDPENHPPFAEEPERAALGCILLAPESAGKMLPKLSFADFYDRRHQTIYMTIRKLVTSGQLPDSVALVQCLKDGSQLQDAGGIGYVSTLANATPSAANFGYYLPILKDKAARRNLLQLSGHAEKLACNESLDARELTREFTELAERIAARSGDPKDWVRFYSPSECRNYVPPLGHLLAGDCHIVRGNVTVIAGAPGIGKSRALTAMAYAGATESEWFGLRVHRKFKTAIIQNENGLYRLSKEFAEIKGDGLDDFMRISSPPPFGMAFGDPGFRAALADWLAEFGPDVVALDPWNSAARDDKHRDYWETFNCLKETLPKGEQAPALVIVAHTKKPQGDLRKRGRALLAEVAGSYVLISVPRCVFVMQAASDDPQDDRIVWTCSKNNDGEEGPRTAWHRRNGLFAPCHDFDWESFDGPAERRRTITIDDLDALFDSGSRKLARPKAVAELMEQTQLNKTACYDALKLDGKFSEHLAISVGLLEWRP
jgi:hypothetical protein